MKKILGALYVATAVLISSPVNAAAIPEPTHETTPDDPAQSIVPGADDSGEPSSVIEIEGQRQVQQSPDDKKPEDVDLERVEPSSSENESPSDIEDVSARSEDDSVSDAEDVSTSSEDDSVSDREDVSASSEDNSVTAEDVSASSEDNSVTAEDVSTDQVTADNQQNLIDNINQAISQMNSDQQAQVPDTTLIPLSIQCH